MLDAEFGYVLTPHDARHPPDHRRGIRAAATIRPRRPISTGWSRSRAAFFPLAERRDAKLWLGRRPCLPDMLPIIGAAPRHKGLWFDFGHQHLGLTFGPVSGLLLAQLMTGEAPFTDPAPYRAERFG